MSFVKYRAVTAAANCDSNDCDITASLRDMRTKTGTKNIYNGKLRVFSDWATSNGRNCLHSDGSIGVPIEKHIFVALDSHEKR